MKKRILSLLLAGGMILTSLVLPGGTASKVEAAPGDSLVAHYKFDGDFKDSVSSKEATGLVSDKTDDPGGTVPTLVEKNEVRGQVMQSGTKWGRMKTENPLKGKDLSGFTVSAWIDANAVDTWLGVWSFSSGDTNTNGFFGMSTNGSLFYNSNPASPDWQDMTSFGGTITANGGWEYITVVMDSEQIHMYKDGALAKELTPNTSGGTGADGILDFVEKTDYLWFGTASPFYWKSGDFYMDDLKVYSEALSADDVLAEYLADETEAKAIVAADKNALTIPTTVSQDLQLPAAGASEYTKITWESSDSTVITSDGKVTRGEEDKEVTLTATLTVGTVTDTKTFTVTVPKANPDGDMAMYQEQLTLNAGYVYKDLELPETIGQAQITWTSGNESIIANDGTVSRPNGEEATEVKLKATLSLAGAADVEKEFTLKVIPAGHNVASYVSDGAALETDGLKGQKGGMKLAAEGEDGYEALHKDQPIMYTAEGNKYYVSPVIFRMADGSFGMAAADGGNNNKVFFYESEDLITYENERGVTLSGISNISKLYVVYDMTDQVYKMFVESAAGICYMLTSENLESFEAAERTEFVIPEVEGAPEDAIWASETGLSQAEYDKVAGKFTNPYNTSLDYAGKGVTEITVNQGEDAEAALDAAIGEIKAAYSNGETREYSVRWDASDLEKVDTSRPGMEYTVNGTLGGSAYFTDAEEPLIEERADPCISYDADLDRYYFTASYPVNGKGGADGYDRLVIRVADTIEGLADAEEHVIWDESENQGFGQFIWAPELHKIGDSWYFLSTAARVETGESYDLRPFIMECKNVNDITNPESWGEPQRLKLQSGDTTALNAMSLDMTYFEADGTSYYAWADFTKNTDNPNGVSSIYIASIDPSDPTQLTSKCSVIAVPEYSWELVRHPVNEGPSVIQKDGKVYMAFSASGTGAEYCVGLLTADETADLLDPDSWTKTPYPVLTSGDFDDLLCGPGHNQFTVDENGDPIIVYHARPAAEHATHTDNPLYDACRHAYVKPVLFDSEGVPVLNLSDEEFAAGGSKITVKVKVAGDYEEPEPVLEYNFDEELTDGKAKDSAGDNDATLHGQPTYVQDDSYGQVLYLDGDDGDSLGGHDSYLEFPAGFFDGRDSMTISFDMNEVTRTGNYFVFTIGQDNNKYIFLKVDPTNMRLSITKNTYTGEQTASYSSVYPNSSRTWMNLKLVITENYISIYRNGELIAEEKVSVSISDLGTDLKAYIGKSFYSADAYFRGYFDNVKVYDYAMGSDEVARVYQIDEEARIAMLQDVQRVADTFEIPNADSIKGNITLPSEKDGVNISWTSSDESVITSKEVNGKPAGVVTRQAADTKVTLTAVFSKDGQQSVTKTYEVTVKAKAKEVTEDDYVGYLFVHFTGHESAASHEQTYFSISEDGLNWSELNGGNAVLTSNIGESGLRDHYIARAPEGDKYYMIATDLSIYHNPAGNLTWANAGGSGSHGIVVWESDDLVNWSEPWIAEIAPENAGCTWAPEFIYDESTGEYVVYWSATSIELDAEGNIAQEYENHTIYYAKTRDFRTFTDAQVYHSGGYREDGTPIKVIDSTMIEDNGTYYRYTKNEMNGTIVIDKSNSILGNFTDIPSETLSKDLFNAQGAVEGPIIFKMNEKDEKGNEQWCLMVDRFGRGQGYYPLITTDLDSGKFTMLEDDEFNMPGYRHGYVMPLTAKEYDTLQREWGDEDYFSTYALDDLIETAEGIDRDTLTEESAAKLEAAITAAKTAREAAKTLNDVDAAVTALQEVINNLEYKVEITLDSLQITPGKTAYTVGDKFDSTGLIAYAVYSNGPKVDVSGKVSVDATKCDMNAAGTYTVTVSYTEDGKTVSASYQITVKAKGEPKPPTDPGVETPDPSTRPGNPQNPGTSDPVIGAGYGGGGTVQTGDTTNILPAALTCIFAFAAAAAVVGMKRRKRF